MVQWIAISSCREAATPLLVGSVLQVIIQRLITQLCLTPKLGVAADQKKLVGLQPALLNSHRLDCIGLCSGVKGVVQLALPASVLPTSELS